jgi:hypothetical protein
MDNDQSLSRDDRDAISRLIIELAWRIDHGQADRVAELFVENGTMTLGGPTLSGHDALRKWGLERSKERLTRHVCTNIRIVGNGSGQAEATTLLTAYIHDGNGPAAAAGVMEYQDKFERVGGEWRIVSRRLERPFPKAEA